MRAITAVALDITTVCNLRCPQCCCRMDTRKAEHYPWEYFAALAPYIYGIDRVDITGGEPTCHPQFGEFVPKFRELFGCKRLTLETNGFKARENEEALRCFDYIRVGRYPENGAVIDCLQREFGAVKQNGSTCIEIAAPGDERGHISRERRGSGAPCHLGYCEFALFSEGKFWPCRLGPAVEGMPSIEPCFDWREKIASMPLPCMNCWFSP